MKPFATNKAPSLNLHPGKLRRCVKLNRSLHLPPVKKLLPFIAALLIFNIAFGQNKAVIKGKVVDSATREPIESAVVTEIPTGKTTVTDKDGNFLLNGVKADSLSFSCIGCKAIRLKAVFGVLMMVGIGNGVINLKDVTHHQ